MTCRVHAWAGAADALGAVTALERRLAGAGTVWTGAVQEVVQQRSMVLMWAEPAAAGDVGSAPVESPTCMGYVLVKQSSLAAHITALAVAPEHRRRGVGRALVQVRQWAAAARQPLTPACLAKRRRGRGRELPPRMHIMHAICLPPPCPPYMQVPQAALKRTAAGPCGRREATLVVGASNAPALALYGCLGFRPEGPPLADWYGPGLHAQRMVLPAGQPGSGVAGGSGVRPGT